MITSIDSTFDRMNVAVGLEEAGSILRALSLGKDRIPEDRKAVVGELQAALLAFLYPAVPEGDPNEED